MQALRTNTQLVSLTLPLNRNARANTRQVEMCTCLVLVVWWSALGETFDGLGVFHLGVLGGCLVWGGFAFLGGRLVVFWSGCPLRGRWSFCGLGDFACGGGLRFRVAALWAGRLVVV